MRIFELDQNSDAWLDWRKTGIGSSDAPAILDLSPWKTRKETWEEKTYHYHRGRKGFSQAQLAAIRAKMMAKELENESAKNRGKKLEPVAREEYEAWMGFDCPAVCGSHEQYEFLKVSLDGWNEDKLLFVEIKAPNRKAHEDALSGSVPDYYEPQILHQFAVSGARRGHYISYHPKFPPGQRLAIVEVDRNDEEVNSLIAVEVDFWNMVVEGEYQD